METLEATRETTEKTYTIPWVCECAGMDNQALRNWIASGMLRPVHFGTTGTGRGHRFSRMQIVALAYALAWQQTGVSKRYLRTVIANVMSYAEAELVRKFKTGYVIVLPVRDTPLVCVARKGSVPELLDLREVYYTVMQRLNSSERAQRLAPRPSRGA